MSVKFKYYLRGCGLGILVASVVFMVSLHTHGGAMSDEKAMQRASELGMIMPDDTETQKEGTQTTEIPVKETNIPDTQRTTQAVTQKIPQKDTDTQKQTEKDTSADTQKQTEKDTSAEQKSTQKESEQKSEEKKKTQDSEKKEEKEEKVSITIKGGEVCREIAQDLQAKGMIKDSEDFRKYMQDHNYARYIRVGTFTLKKGMNYSEIAKVLTKK